MVLDSIAPSPLSLFFLNWNIEKNEVSTSSFLTTRGGFPSPGASPGHRGYVIIKTENCHCHTLSFKTLVHLLMNEYININVSRLQMLAPNALEQSLLPLQFYMLLRRPQ